jgi:putative ABC transport system permease protein
VTVQQALAETQALARRSALQYPESDSGNAVDLRSFLSDYTGDAAHGLTVISAAVVLLLIIACANVANLTLACTMKRQREIALRLALGASRFRVIRLLLTESVVLAIVGGIIGVAIAVWAVEFFKATAPESLPRLTDVHVDLIILISTIALTLASGVLSGLTPAWQMTRPELDTMLSAGGQQISGILTSNRLRNILMVTEVALAFLLLVASGLLVKSFRNLVNEDRGYDARNVLNFRLRLADTKYPDPLRSISMLKETQSRLSRLPGVERVALGTAVPLGRFMQRRYWVEGTPEPQNISHWLLSTSLSVSEGYHEALGIKLLAERCFNDHDRGNSHTVVMIDDQFVRRNFASLQFGPWPPVAV